MSEFDDLYSEKVLVSSKFSWFMLLNDVSE